MMDPSVLEFLEEDQDESMGSEDEVNTIHSDVEGENHSSSPATLRNGVGGANTNLLRQHTLEITWMKEEKPSVLVDQNQELMQENESHRQQNPPQDHFLPVPGQLWENPSCVPQSSNLPSVNKPTGNEPERPQPQYLKQQKTSTRQVHGLEYPIGPVKHGRGVAPILHLVRNLIARVDKDKGIQLLTLYSKFKRNEITNKGLLRQMRDIVGDQMVRLATRKAQSFQPGTDMANNWNVESIGGPTKSTINLMTGPKFESPTSVNGESRDHGGSISHYQNNTSLPLYSAPLQVSVTKDQTVAPPLSSVVHVKHQSVDQAHKPRSLVQQAVSNVPVKQNNGKRRRSIDDLEKQPSNMGLSISTTHASFGPPSMTTQMDSNAMVRWPASSGTTPAGANVRMTPKTPYVGQKKPFETVDSSFSPLRKKQKLCGTSLKQSIKQLNDVTAVSGINLRDEEEQLLLSRPQKKSCVTKASRGVVLEEEERTVLQKIPLKRKLAEISWRPKSGLKHIKDDVVWCLSLCVEERMRGLLYNAIRMSKQRNNTEQCRSQTCVVFDIRKQINDMNQKVKEEQERQHGGEEQNEENHTGKEDNLSEQVKAKKEDGDKTRAKAANVAALAAARGNDSFLKWKLMAEARKKPSSKKLYGEIGSTRIGKKQGLTKAVRSISAKDVIDVMEMESQMSKSTLLYRLYNRICSDV